MERASLLGYRTTRIVNLDTRRQILALYERSISLSRAAVTQLRVKDVQGALEQLWRCERCLAELQAALNFPQGEEIAVNLWHLYEYVRVNVELAGEHLDSTPLEDVLFVLEALRDGWIQLLGRQARRRNLVVRTYREPVQPGHVC
jgi:flagellar biosynthetic protein FliS